MNGMLIVLCGSSGAGTGKVFEEISRRRSNVRKVLSVTSRPHRADDPKEPNYVFVSEREFKAMIARGEFYEWIVYDGHLYGTLNIPAEELTETDLFFDKDIVGALRIKKQYPETITIYIMPKDVDTLLKRRGDRGTDRQKIGIDEIEPAKQLDFLVINDNIEDTVDQVENIIECMRKNGMKNKRNLKFLDEFY